MGFFNKLNPFRKKSKVRIIGEKTKNSAKILKNKKDFIAADLRHVLTLIKRRTDVTKEVIDKINNLIIKVERSDQSDIIFRDIEVMDAYIRPIEESVQDLTVKSKKEDIVEILESIRMRVMRKE